MKMFKAGVAAAALLTGVVTAAPAQAATGWDRCVYGYFCAFTGPSGTGVIAMYNVGDPNLADAYGPQGMNNNIESVWNRDSKVWWAHKDHYQSESQGYPQTFKYGSLPDGYSNTISALRRDT